MKRRKRPRRLRRDHRCYSERAAVALHEAGHTVVALGVRRGFSAVSIVPKGGTLGHVMMVRLRRNAPPGRSLAEVVVALAGLAAQQLATGSRELPAGCEVDLLSALPLILRLGGTLPDALRLTRQLLTRRWLEVLVLAGALLEEGTLSAAEVRRVLRT